MAERPDLRQIAGNIGESLDDFDRESLLEILKYVFKEYLVEGPPPMLVHQTETIEDLGGLDFAELITTLQTRLELPELDLLQVRDGQVFVRAGGALVPLAADAQQPMRMIDTREPEPPPRPQAPAAEPVAQAPRASVDEAVRRGRGDLAGGERGPIQAPAPRPRGISVNGRTPRNPSAAPPAVQSSAPKEEPKPAEASKPPEPKPAEPDEDDASIRFSLLELD